MKVKAEENHKGVFTSLLYIIYTNSFKHTSKRNCDMNFHRAFMYLQLYINILQNWLRRWKILNAII